MEWEYHSSTQNGTEQDGTERERNDLKKVGTCPALVVYLIFKDFHI